MNIPLLADKNHSVSRAYGVLKEDDGIPFRGLFIIDGKSVLRQVSFLSPSLIEKKNYNTEV